MTTKEDAAPPLARPPCSASLIWNPGPANGGAGNSESLNGKAWWSDSTLLVIVELREGVDIMAVNVSDGEMFLHGSGDDTGWTLDDVSWWADLDAALPPIIPAPNAPSDRMAGATGGVQK